MSHFFAQKCDHPRPVAVPDLSYRLFRFGFTEPEIDLIVVNIGFLGRETMPTVLCVGCTPELYKLISTFAFA